MNLPPKFRRSSPDDGFVVAVDIGIENIPNDLIGALSANLSRYSDSGSSHDVIIEPSDVVAFHLSYKRQTASRSNLDTFIYPKALYLDRFLQTNAEIANQRRRLEQEMNVEIARLTAQKETLTRHNVSVICPNNFEVVSSVPQNRDTLADLRSTLYYYEHVASATDPERERQIHETISKLHSILAAITERLGGELLHMLCIFPGNMSDVNIVIDRRIEKLRTGVATIFDCPELQNYRVGLSICILCLHCSYLGNIV